MSIPATAGGIGAISYGKTHGFRYLPPSPSNFVGKARACSCLTGIGYVKVGGAQNLAKTRIINSPPPTLANFFYSFDFYTFPQHLWESKGKIRK